MFRSEKYRAFVRVHVCCAPLCSKQADVAHHWGKVRGGGGTGCKPHDTYEVPLCTEHHGEVHQKGTLPHLSAGEVDDFFCRVSLQLVTEYWMEHGQAVT